MKARVMNIFLTKKPHEGMILKNLTEKENLFVITSNIDEHFRSAGFDGNKLYEIHGRLKILQCIDRKCNQHHNLWPLDYLPQEKDMTLIGDPPKCIYCGKCARPNVCFTDDNSFCNKLRLAQQATFKKWIKAVSSRRKPKLLVLEIVCGRHKDSIGMQKLSSGQFRVLSKELQYPTNLNEENMKIIRINPDKNIPKESWEEVHYTTGLKFFQQNFS